MKMNKAILYFFSLLLVFTACEENHIPKPMGLIRVTFPENGTYTFSDGQCPYSFDAPKYAFIVPVDTTHNFCHKNIFLPYFKATLHCSYLELNSSLADNVANCQKLAYEHRVKASAIDEIQVNYPEHNVHGMIYKIEGNVASNFQFYITDSTKNFFRGSLYFNARPNIDSLKPYLDFVTADLEKMIESFQWVPVTK